MNVIAKTIFDWVAMDICRCLQQLCVIFSKHMMKSSTKNRTIPTMVCIQMPCITTIKIAHGIGNISMGRFNEKMIVISHQHISMNFAFVLLNCGLQVMQKFIPMRIT